jgi:hypothetical protein
MGHIDDLKYAKERWYEIKPAELQEWIFRRGPDGIYEASGPCPTCKGTAYGPRLAEIERGEPTRGEEADVVCECHCDYDHGGGEDKGCGRWWIASTPVDSR